jgi:hypothetical protein
MAGGVTAPASADRHEAEPPPGACHSEVTRQSPSDDFGDRRLSTPGFMGHEAGEVVG